MEGFPDTTHHPPAPCNTQRHRSSTGPGVSPVLRQRHQQARVAGRAPLQPGGFDRWLHGPPLSMMIQPLPSSPPKGPPQPATYCKPTCKPPISRLGQHPIAGSACAASADDVPLVCVCRSCTDELPVQIPRTDTASWPTRKAVRRRVSRQMRSVGTFKTPCLSAGPVVHHGC